MDWIQIFLKILLNLRIVSAIQSVPRELNAGDPEYPPH